MYLFSLRQFWPFPYIKVAIETVATIWLKNMASITGLSVPPHAKHSMGIYGTHKRTVFYKVSWDQIICWFKL